jgi:DNA polymerase III subunit delta'
MNTDEIMVDLNNNSLAGHDKNRTVLLKLFHEGFVSGSYLFSGIESVGKKLTALWFAKLLNCREENAPCGVCVSCRKIDGGIHPDVKLITRDEAKTVITIDQVRGQVIDEANYKPFEGKYRVFIVDDAHLLNEQAQNAMLKTLEEPGETVVLVLVTSRPSELLPTIVSRCRELRFFPLSREEMEKILQVKADIEPEKLKLLTVFSTGAPGKALELADDKDFWKRREDIFGILEKLPDGKLGDILKFCESYNVSRTDIKALESTFEIMLSWFRDMLFLKSEMSADFLVNKDFCMNMNRVVFCFEPEDLLAIQDMILEMRKLVFENNLNIKMVLQRLFIRIKQAGSVKI